MTVFDMFSLTPYDFLEVTRGTVYGNRITSEKANLLGVFKLRANMQQSGNIETELSSATLHAKPEDFAETLTPDLVGQGVRVEGVTYQIISVTEGKNFETGEVEHLTFSLERANYAAQS